MNTQSNATTASHALRDSMDNSCSEAIDFGEPLDFDVRKITATAEPSVCLLYDKKHELEGKLLLVSRSHFLDLHSRFYDILPSYIPSLEEEHCRPWTLLHRSLGKTWIHVRDLPVAAAFLGACDILRGAKELSFIAVTDHSEAYAKAYWLGEVDLQGHFVHSPDVAAGFIDDIIIALPTDRPFSGKRQIGSYHISKTLTTPITVVDDYAPMPVSPQLLDMMKKIRLASIDPESAMKGKVNKTWLKNTFQGITDKGYLPRHHELYRHRGNEAVFPRSFWHMICYPVKLSEHQALVDSKGQGGKKIPSPYYQALFPDLQKRERVEGSERLKGVPDRYCGDFEPHPALGLNVLRLEGNGLYDGGNGEGMLLEKL